jgi:hypothetical protein
MARRSKSQKRVSLTRQVIAQNVVAFRDRIYAGLPTTTARNRALAKDADTTLSQIQRVISMELGTSVDLIEALATALRVRPQDLVTPYFAVSVIEKLPVPAELQRIGRVSPAQQDPAA